MRSFPVAHGHMPGTAHESRIIPKGLDLQIAEFQAPHFSPGLLIVLAIAIDGALPAGGLLSSGEERQVGRVPVARHEAFEVMAVPGLLLLLEESPDGGCWISGLWYLGKQRNKRYSGE